MQAEGVQAAAEQPAIEKPEGLDERFFDPEKGVKWNDLTKEFEDLAALKNAQDLRKSLVPEKTDGYALEFPDGTMPEGVEIDPDDPAWSFARELSHELGHTQDEFAKVGAKMAAAAKAQAEATAALDKQIQEREAEKLGANAAQMYDAVNQWMSKNLSPETVQILQASRVGASASLVKDFARLAQAMSNAGVSGLGAVQRDGVQGISDEQWAKMSFGERLVAGLPKTVRH